MMYVQAVTMLTCGRPWSSVSADQQGTGEGGQSCLSPERGTWAQCECILRRLSGLLQLLTSSSVAEDCADSLIKSKIDAVT